MQNSYVKLTRDMIIATIFSCGVSCRKDANRRNNYCNLAQREEFCDIEIIRRIETPAAIIIGA